jgi:hypothetical protein
MESTKNGKAPQVQEISIDASLYVDRETRSIKAIPLSKIETKAQALRCIKAIEEFLGEIRFADVIGNPACEVLHEALFLESIPLADVQKILTLPIQFIQIHDLTLLQTVGGGSFSAYFTNRAQYLDLLLFVAELHDPSVNRLRKDRRKYDLCCHTASGDTSKEPTVSEYETNLIKSLESRFKKGLAIQIEKDMNKVLVREIKKSPNKYSYQPDLDARKIEIRDTLRPALAKQFNEQCRKLLKIRINKHRKAFAKRHIGYEETPEPTVATVAWEKRVREDSDFENWESKINSFQNNMGFSYWAISMGSRCTDSHKWFLVFDANLRLNIAKSDFYTKELNDPDYDDITKFEASPFVDFCLEFNLEYAGTPFYPTQTDLQRSVKPIHFLAQQVSVSFRNNSYQVFIPSFYRSTHIKRLLKADFYDLRFALDGNLFLKAKAEASVSRTDSCPLTNDEMYRLAKCINGIFKEYFNISEAQAYRNTATAMSPWWVSKIGYNSSLVRAVRPPNKVKTIDKTLEVLPLREVIQMVSDNFDDINPDTSLRYAFDRYRGKLKELKRI